MTMAWVALGLAVVLWFASVVNLATARGALRAARAANADAEKALIAAREFYHAAYDKEGR